MPITPCLMCERDRLRAENQERLEWNTHLLDVLAAISLVCARRLPSDRDGCVSFLVEIAKLVNGHEQASRRVAVETKKERADDEREFARLRAEIERLRAALDWYRTARPLDLNNEGAILEYQRVARATLNGLPVETPDGWRQLHQAVCRWSATDGVGLTALNKILAEHNPFSEKATGERTDV